MIKKWQYLIKILKDLPGLSQETGYSIPNLLWSFSTCYISSGVLFEVFRALRLYEYSYKRRSEFLLMAKKYSDILNAEATEEDILLLNGKNLFNAAFHDFIRRDWLYLPDSTPEDILAFIARNDAFLAKAATSTQGKNIYKFISGETDPEDFLTQWQGKPFLLEAIIRQHPAMSALNPSSVNTVRIQTIRKGDRVKVTGACLRCGGVGAYVDNFHAGGVAYPIDTDTGVIIGDGRNTLGQLFRRHPPTGYYMPGFQIPFWDELTAMIRKAAVMPPHIGYVGWDVAITEEGPELIEGNVNYPDPVVVQLDGHGIRKDVKDFIKEVQG